jgi:hypothetical protein
LAVEDMKEILPMTQVTAGQVVGQRQIETMMPEDFHPNRPSGACSEL